MFVFHSSEQNESNKNYYKGILFEKLLSVYLERLGYKITIRAKYNSLEYDLEGTHKATSQKMLGEAKAFEKNISGQILAAFVGKLLPLGLMTKDVKGLFLSTSPLTSEAEDYFRTIKDYGINVFTGQQLYSSIIETLKYPNPENIKENFSKNGYIVQAEYILATNNGNFLVFVTGNADSVTPTFISLYNHKGEIVSDNKFINSIISSINEFTSLKALTITDGKDIQREIRNIDRGLTVGSSWIDYRLPAGPKFFIGRDALILQILKDIKDVSETNIFQVKSRSGVGKSSILSIISSKLEEVGLLIELHDSRNIKSVLDLRSIMKRFTNIENTPQDMREVENAISEFATRLGSNKAIFIVDQFESTFNNVDIFNAYESIANIFLKYKRNLVFLLARKNDQLTTYDDTKITLNRLNEISMSYLLSDFTSSEAAELIKRINDNSSISVGNDVLSYVLEFAQGFPWLLKRTMAHIVKLVNQLNIPQNELFAVGLKLDDLFDEELDGLDEIEKEYLFKIAAKLPSSFHQLQVSFDEDPMIPKVLDKLTQMRLLRMTGTTYDTYNDVFKEYLVYKRLPEFKQAIIYRTSPNRIISSFLNIVKYESFTNEELEKYLKIGRGTLFNNIREWRNLGMLERSGDIWSIPKKVIDIYNKKLLGEYIRRQLIDNDVITKLLIKINSDKFTDSQLPDFLKEQFLFVEATEQTWQIYSNILKSWLISTRIITIDNEGILKPEKMSRDQIINELGNLDNLKTGKRKSADIFLPSASWHHVIDTIDDLLVESTHFKGEKMKALNDLKSGGWYLDGFLMIHEKQSMINHIREYLISEPYSSVWKAAQENKKLLPILSELLPSDMTIETRKWRLKKLLNWGRNLEIIENKRYKYL